MKAAGKRIAVWTAVFVLAGVMMPIPAVRAEDAQPIDTRSKELPETTEEEDEETKKAYEMTVDSNKWKNWPIGPQTYGEAGIVMDAESGAVLYAKNIDGKAYPASITKVLTTLVALENASMDDIVTVSADAVNGIPYGYAHVGLKAGEEITLKDALYAVLLASANEASYAVGESVGTKVSGNAESGYEWFLAQMNTRAKELGAVNSNFVNTNGLENEEHYTTARDMALITRELLLNHPEFETISQTLQYTIPPTKMEEEPRTFQQVHQMFYEGNDYFNPRVIAGKTGYTDLARNTLVTCAQGGELKLICVVLKTHGKNIYPDTQQLLDYGVGNFEKVNIEENETSGDIQIVDGKSYVVLPSHVKFEDLEKEFVPDEKDEASGVMNYTYEGNPVGSAEATVSQEYLTKAAEEESEGKEAEKRDEKGEKETTKETEEEPVIKKVIIIGALLLIVILAFSIAYTALRKKRMKKKKRKS